MQMHQSQQRESFRSLANRMLRQDVSESYGFVAKLSSDGGLRVGREIALGEQQVEDLTYGGESRGKLRLAWPVGAWRKFSQLVSRSSKALVHIGFTYEKSKRDLPNVETAEGLQSQHQL